MLSPTAPSKVWASEQKLFVGGRERRRKEGRREKGRKRRIYCLALGQSLKVVASTHSSAQGTGLDKKPWQRGWQPRFWHLLCSCSII